MTHMAQEAGAVPRLSSQEQVFGFQDEAFREYMMTDEQNKLRPDYVLGLVDAMATHDHPLVRYAAGWAAAELAVRRRGLGAQPSQTYALRTAALDRAAPLWADAEEGFTSAAKTAGSPDAYKQFLGYSYRARQAQAYLPNLQSVAELYCRRMPDAAVLESRMDRTQAACLELGGDIFRKMKKGSTETRITLSGINYELLAGLVMGRIRPPEVVIVPASLRQDHNHHDSRRRSDLSAVIMRPPHRRVLVGVTGRSDEGAAQTNHMRLVVRAWEDLRLDDTTRPLVTLQSLIKGHRGEEIPEHEEARIQEIGETLVARLVEFENVLVDGSKVERAAATGLSDAA